MANRGVRDPSPLINLSWQRVFPDPVLHMVNQGARKVFLDLVHYMGNQGAKYPTIGSWSFDDLCPSGGYSLTWFFTWRIKAFLVLRTTTGNQGHDFVSLVCYGDPLGGVGPVQGIRSVVDHAQIGLRGICVEGEDFGAKGAQVGKIGHYRHFAKWLHDGLSGDRMHLSEVKHQVLSPLCVAILQNGDIIVEVAT
ncbi:hypothetical protein QYF36_008805 [Acer negundo]|nr:hypothetical protein QYF36_008805 [Acer negundo]